MHVYATAPAPPRRSLRGDEPVSDDPHVTPSTTPELSTTSSFGIGLLLSMGFIGWAITGFKGL